MNIIIIENGRVTARNRIRASRGAGLVGGSGGVLAKMKDHKKQQ